MVSSVGRFDGRGSDQPSLGFDAPSVVCVMVAEAQSGVILGPDGPKTDGETAAVGMQCLVFNFRYGAPLSAPEYVKRALRVAGPRSRLDDAALRS